MLDLENVFLPRRWPQRMRRTFVLTLPVSLPLWLATAAVVVVGTIVTVLVLGLVLLIFVEPALAIRRLWTGDDE